MRSIIQHLRFPFSYLLLPVFLMGLTFTYPLVLDKIPVVILLFVILHLLVYPSSNAYNSTQDRDESSIGLVKNPLPINESLNWISAVMDCVAIGLASIISAKVAFLFLIYILVSRLYSYRKIRLKKYPIIGFLVVFIFQGAWVYFITISSLNEYSFQSTQHYFFAASASCLIGAIYPLSQIYQHQTDKADGVITISYMLGKKGTFIFSGILFLLGAALLIYPVYKIGDHILPLIFIAFQVPSLIYFNYWFYKVIKDESEANFKNTMRMSLLSATCMNAFFLFVFIAN